MYPREVDVCVIDGDAAQRALLRRRLRTRGYDVVEAADAEAGLRLIRDRRPGVVICNVELRGGSGVELCAHVRATAPLDGTYLILVSAVEDRDVLHAALNAGADDFLCKPFDMEEFDARLRNGHRIARLQQRLRAAAITDGLTGLSNHAQFRKVLAREFQRALRYGSTVSLLMLDLDHFKVVNDTYGHEIGNDVLQAVARTIEGLVRSSDVVSRYGGEEFAVICPETELGRATELAERIRQAIADRVRVPREPALKATVTIGVASSALAGVSTESDLINLADHALYVGKRRGRNQVMRCDAQPRPGLEDLRHSEIDEIQKQVFSLSLQAKEMCLQSVWVLIQALEARDPYTAWHSRNTTYYAGMLAEAAGWDLPLQTALVNAAMLHSLGKVGVPDSILQSTAPLTAKQAATLRQVPMLTCKILEPLRAFEAEILIIRHLRERYDGTGYPFGLAGETIPIGSRLLSVAETFDALTSDRPYRAHVSIDEAVSRIEAEARRQFDPQFTQLIAQIVRDRRPAWEARVERSLAEMHQLRPVGSAGTAITN